MKGFFMAALLAVPVLAVITLIVLHKQDQHEQLQVEIRADQRSERAQLRKDFQDAWNGQPIQDRTAQFVAEQRQAEADRASAKAAREAGQEAMREQTKELEGRISEPDDKQYGSAALEAALSKKFH